MDEWQRQMKIFILAEVSKCCLWVGRVLLIKYTWHITVQVPEKQLCFKVQCRIKKSEFSVFLYKKEKETLKKDRFFWETASMPFVFSSLCGPETVRWLTSSERRSVKLSVDYFSLISIYKSPVIHYLHSYLAVIFVGQQWLNLSQGLIDRVRSSLSTLLKLKTNVSAPFMGRSAVKLACLVIADRSGMF